MNRVLNIGLAVAILAVTSVAYGQTLADMQATSAAAEVARARAAVGAAESHLIMVEAAIKDSLQSSSEFLAAQQNLNVARAAYSKAYDKVMDGLAKDPVYEAEAAACEQATQAVDDARDNGAAPDEIAKLASEALKASESLSSTQETALDADQVFQTAKAALMTANSACEQLKQQIDNAIRLDPKVEQATDQLDQAKVATDAAQGALAAAQLEQEKADRTER